MKALSLLLMLALLIACSPPEQAAGKPAPQAAAPDSHASGTADPEAHAAGESVVVAKPAPATGWATDAPLREGMGRIRSSVDALANYEQGHTSAEQAAEMATNIERDVNFLIANCKLDPDADAALHGIIGKLLKGAHALKADPANVAAIAPMREAMAEYARDFDDPAFRIESSKP